MGPRANKRRTALQQNSSPSRQRRRVRLLRFGFHLTLVRSPATWKQTCQAELDRMRVLQRDFRYNQRCDGNTSFGSLADNPKWLRVESAKRS